MKFIIKILLYLGLFALMGFLLIYLFFQQEFNNFFPIQPQQQNVSNLTLKIAYNTGFDSFDPVKSDANTRTRTLNIYESLIATDRNLQKKPGLAVSWGRINDTTWEFKLRPDVKFHDETSFDADDVIASFDRALNNPDSDLKDRLNTISSINKIDNLTIHIKTNTPDPILEDRVASVLIFPSEKKDFTTPVGTASYKYAGQKDNELGLERFDDYWGAKPYYKTLLIQTIENRFSRIDALKNGDIDILANVPPSFTKELKEHDRVNIVAVPSLEVNFLIFNFDNDFFKNKNIRRAIAMAFDKEPFVDFSNGYALPSDQFVSNGVYGYNPSIKPIEQDVEAAKSIIREYDPFKRPSISLDMVKGAEGIGEFIKSQLNEIGITVNVNYLTFDLLREKIFNRESEMYMLGWRSDMGGASGFLENVVYSTGQFNGGNFDSKKVDQLIDLSLKNLDEKKRLEQTQNIMKIITEDEIIGVPLFETEIIYGIHTGIYFHPRLDGYILASEISK